MPDEIHTRESLRELVANDAYAATFQSIGQYRAALLKHISNRETAERAARLKTNAGMNMVEDKITARAEA